MSLFATALAPPAYDFASVWDAREPDAPVVLPTGDYDLRLIRARATGWFVYPEWRVLSGIYAGRRAHTCGWSVRPEDAAQLLSTCTALGITAEELRGIKVPSELVPLLEGRTTHATILETGSSLPRLLPSASDAHEGGVR
jgi:hypothetical protein